MIKRMTIRNNPAVINALVHDLKYTDENGDIVTIASDAAINERIITKFKYYDYLYTIEDANASILQDIVNSWRLKVIELYKTTLYEYNPIWNVDGTEEREVTTVYGHKIERKAGTTEATTDTTKIVNTQTADAETSTTYGRKDTTTYGRKDTTTYGGTSTNAHTVGASHSRNDFGYDSSTAAPSFSEASNDGTHATTTGGSDNVQLSGNDAVQLSGTDATTYNAGTTQSQRSGGISTTHSGSDNDTHSGTDKVTDKLVRGGNIGVTSTQSLIQQERDIIIDVVEFYVEQFADAFNINPLIFLNKYATQEDF